MQLGNALLKKQPIVFCKIVQIVSLVKMNTIGQTNLARAVKCKRIRKDLKF